MDEFERLNFLMDVEDMDREFERLSILQVDVYRTQGAGLCSDEEMVNALNAIYAVWRPLFDTYCELVQI